MSGRPAFPPPLGVAVAVLSVSFAAPLFRMAEADALVASFWRLAFAVALLVPFSVRAWPRWATYTRADWGLIALTGLALALHFALWVRALQLTTVAAATVLVTLQAVFVALGSHLLLRERMGGRAWVGVLVAVAGGVVIATTDGTLAPAGPHALLGDLLALLAGIGSAAYMLVGRKLRATRGLLEYVVPVYAFAAVLLFVAMPVVGQDPGAGLGSRDFVVFVLLAAVPMLGGHTVSNWCLKYLPAHTIASWILLEPVGAALLAWPLLDEVPHPLVAVGGVLAIAGAFLTIPRSGARAAPAEVAG